MSAGELVGVRCERRGHVRDRSECPGCGEPDGRSFRLANEVAGSPLTGQSTDEIPAADFHTDFDLAASFVIW